MTNPPKYDGSILAYTPKIFIQKPLVVKRQNEDTTKDKKLQACRKSKNELGQACNQTIPESIIPINIKKLMDK